MSNIKRIAKIETDLSFQLDRDKRLTVKGLPYGPHRKDVLPPKSIARISALVLSLLFRCDMVRIQDTDNHFFFVQRRQLIRWVEDKSKEEGTEALTKEKMKNLLAALQKKGKAEIPCPKEVFPLELLPNDLFYEIASYLGIAELQALCLSSKLFNEKVISLGIWQKLAGELKIAVENPEDPSSYKPAVLKAVNECLNKSVEDIPDLLLKDKEFVKRLVIRDPYQLSDLKDEWKDCKEVVLAAVKKDGMLLQHASKTLQNDREVVLAAVEASIGALKHASPDLQKDEYCILLSEVQGGKKKLHELNKIYRGDKRIVRAAFKCNPLDLPFASGELRNDKVFMLSLSIPFYCPLMYAGKKLRNDKEFVLHQVSRYGWALKHASKALRDDKEVVIKAVTFNGYALRGASKRLRDDEEVVRAAMKGTPKALEYASKRFRNDKEMVLASLKSKGHDSFGPSLLWRVSKALRDDEEVVVAAMAVNPDAIRAASKRLREKLRG